MERNSTYYQNLPSNWRTFQPPAGKKKTKNKNKTKTTTTTTYFSKKKSSPHIRMTANQAVKPKKLLYPRITTD